MSADCASAETSNALVSTICNVVSPKVQKRGATRVRIEGEPGTESSAADAASCDVAYDCSGAASLVGFGVLNIRNGISRANPDPSAPKALT